MQKWILVNSHRRSGTHFLIDSLRLNLENVIYPAHRALPKDFNIGSLLNKKESIFKIFKDLLSQNKTILIKSHLLTEEMNLKNPKDKYEELVKKIYLNSYKLYTYRDGKDVLVSLFHFLNSQTPFSSFIREKNDHISLIRDFMDFDNNRVKYWAYHVESWLKEDLVKKIRFKNLKYKFEETISDVVNDITGYTPKYVKKPNIPKNIFTHRIKVNLYKLGILRDIGSTSVKPGTGKGRNYKDYFSEDDFIFYNKNVSSGLISDFNIA